MGSVVLFVLYKGGEYSGHLYMVVYMLVDILLRRQYVSAS